LLLKFRLKNDLKKNNLQNNFRCHSIGAEGADNYFEEIGQKYGVKHLPIHIKQPIIKTKTKLN